MEDISHDARITAESRSYRGLRLVPKSLWYLQKSDRAFKGILSLFLQAMSASLKIGLYVIFMKARQASLVNTPENLWSFTNESDLENVRNI